MQARGQRLEGLAASQAVSQAVTSQAAVIDIGGFCEAEDLRPRR